MNKDRKLLTEKILNFTLEIIYLLTGEDYMVVKKLGNDGTDRTNSCRTQNPGMEPPPRSLIDESRKDEKILALTNAIIRLLTGEVPVRCEDVTVYLSMEEWEYLEGHRDLYNSTPTKNLQLVYPKDKSVSRRTAGKSHTAMTSSDAVKRHSAKNHSGHVTAPEDGTTEKSTRSIHPSTSNETEKATGQKENIRDPDVSTHSVNTPVGYPPVRVKKESDLCKEGNRADVFPSREQASDFTKEEAASHQGGNLIDRELYSPTQIEYASFLVKEESASCEGQDLNDMRTMADSRETKTFKEESPIQEETMSTEHAETMSTEHAETMSTEHAETMSTEHAETMSTEHAETMSTEHAETMSTEHAETEHPSTRIKEEPESWEEVIVTDTEVYTPAEHAQTGDILCNDNAEAMSEDSTVPTPVMSFRIMKFSDGGEIINNKFHTHTVEGMYNCSDCQKCFANNIDVLNHQNAHKEKMLACPECGKDFSCKARLIRHYRSHTGTKLFPCSECGKRLTDKSSLITHQRSHMGDKPFSCTVCGKCFTTQSDLVRHQRTHTGEKPFSCPECGKCFTQSSHLLRHQRLHTGGKIFMCFVCRTSFPDKSSLSTHHRIHAGENPFMCSACGKSFFTQEDLGLHQRVHMEDQSFLCFVCGKCFPDSAQLSRHMKSHAGEEPFFCSA